MAFQAAELDVRGISAVAGNVGLERTLGNALKIVELSGAAAPVYAGADRPMFGAPITAEHFHGEDGLLGAELPAPVRMPEAGPAWEALRREAEAWGGALEVVATGPLTSDALCAEITRLTGTERLSFYDAAAPIVTFESVDMQKAFFAARYGRGEDDYINCPMNREQYEAFHEALAGAERVPLHDFEKLTVYEGCMPVEVLAARGKDAIRYGPLKPVGLTDPATGRRPWAVVQLRAENREGTLYNLVGFQTNLRFGEQKRVFSMIPGLEHAVFARYGVMHRNTFLDSPRLLDARMRLRALPRVRFAGQITGVEGYIESAMSGIYAGIDLARELKGEAPLVLPPVTMSGALLRYVCDSSVRDFQPMGCNMGILPPLEEKIRDKQARYLALAERSMKAMEALPLSPILDPGGN